MIFILALSGNFSVFAANMPDSQELIQQLGIQHQDLIATDPWFSIWIELLPIKSQVMAAA